MKSKPVFRIGLIGYGVVGQGVVKHLQNNRQVIEQRLGGARLVVHRVAVHNKSKKREVPFPEKRITTDPMSIVEDPEIDIVCELMGGVDEAYKLTLKALRAGKAVVTANKALICEKGDALLKAARQGKGHYHYEASVAGGIPVLKVLREGLVANRFHRIYGILNGTSNYILTRMDREGLTFEETLQEARRLGYVEADESLDLDGWDAAHKTIILAFLAHGKWVKLSQMPVEGIRRITLADVTSARELGYKIKLLARIERDFETNQLSLSVRPTFLPKSSVVAGVDDVFNAVDLQGDVVGDLFLAGRGAGQDPTASAVISDIADAVAARLGAPPMAMSDEDLKTQRALAAGCTLAPPEETKSRFYCRMTVSDESGVLSKVTDVLAKAGVSIATIWQEAIASHQAASISLTTHETDLLKAEKAMKQLNRINAVLEPPVLFPIFEP